jgi:hypothetical protein
MSVIKCTYCDEDGALAHVDSDFAYHVKCAHCGTVYMCNGHIELIELEEEPQNCVVDAE